MGKTVAGTDDESIKGISRIHHIGEIFLPETGVLGGSTGGWSA